MPRRRPEPAAAVEEWTREPAEVAPEDRRCGDRAWFWRRWNTFGGVAHYPTEVVCVRERGHPGRHASRPRRSWVWHPGSWHALRW
ncbi:hypothetical protein ACR9E3_08735 [Actinomycetospora sp. C-140]